MLIVSDSKHSLIPAVSSGITIDFSDPDQALKTLLSALQEKKVVAVIATDDLVVTLSSRIAQQLGLPHNHPKSALLTCRKDLARQKLKQQGCNVPEFSVVNFADASTHAQQCQYPVVLKPLMLSGSRGVIRADNASQFLTAATTIEQILAASHYEEYEQQHFLVEEFLVGEEIAIDGFMQDGKFIPLALFDKPEPLNGPYFEESYYITPGPYSREYQQAIIDELTRCCDAYGLTHGPVHAEARLTDKGVFLLEMASRTIGGQCAQIIEYVIGVPLEELIIQMMCLESVKLTRSSDHAGVLMIPIRQKGILKRVEGLLQARQVNHITNLEIHIQPGYELVPLPQGNSYLGFIFARAKTFGDTLESLREAHTKLRFITTQNWAIEAQ